MRNLLFSISFILICTTLSFGQIQKGTWTIDATNGASYERYGPFISVRATTNISADFSYFPVKWLSVGIKSSYVAFRYNFRARPESSEITVNPYLRFYIPSEKKLKFYGQVNPGFHSVRHNAPREYDPATDAPTARQFSHRYITLNPNIGLGLNYFIEKNITLEFGVDAIILDIMDSHRKSTFPNTYGTISTNLIQTPWKDNGNLLSTYIRMRFFLNTKSKDSTPTKSDSYLQQGHQVIGFSGNYERQEKGGFTEYQLSFNYQYFMTKYVSVGTGISYTSFRDEKVGYRTNKPTLILSPTIEGYIPLFRSIQAVPHISLNIPTVESDIPGKGKPSPITTNFGLKINAFVQKNISVWTGAFVLYYPEAHKKWLFNTGFGINYFILPKKTSE